MAEVIGECVCISHRTQELADCGVPEGYGALIIAIPADGDFRIGDMLFKTVRLEAVRPPEE
jgi:hypothetical protein